MQKIASLALLLAGAIHLIPLLGVFGAAPLASLYGTPPSDPNTLILLRHRAVLFGIVGGICMGAAFKPAYQCLGLALACLVAGAVARVRSERGRPAFNFV
nr:phosphopantetheine adenylyltransferase [uncultured Acidovorax sp.]